VREQIVRDTGAGKRRVHAPGGGARGIGAPLLLVGGVVVEDRAEAPLVDELSGKGDRGHPAIVEPDQCRDAARGALHPLRLVQRQGERLLTQDDLSGFGRRDGGGTVEVIRQRDIDRVDVFPIDGGAPVGGRRFPAPPVRHRRKRPGIPAAEQCSPNPVRKIEEMRRLAIGVRVGLAHEALSEERNAEFGFHV